MQHRLAVGEKDVVPHHRIAASNASEVAKTTGSITEYLEVLVPLRQQHEPPHASFPQHAGIVQLAEVFELLGVAVGGVEPTLEPELERDARRLDLMGHAHGLVEVTRRMSGDELAASVMVLCIGTGVSITDLRRARQYLPVDTRVIAVRCLVGQEPSVRWLGDLGVLTLGRLDELGVAVRRVAT